MNWKILVDFSRTWHAKPWRAIYSRSIRNLRAIFRDFTDFSAIILEISVLEFINTRQNSFNGNVLFRTFIIEHFLYRIAYFRGFYGILLALSRLIELKYVSGQCRIE
jgi:hypothetical protein